MQDLEARLALGELVRLNRGAHAARATVWFPLSAFGLIHLVGVPLAWLIGRDSLGLYFAPAHVAGGIACALYYSRAGRTSGLQAPLYGWLAAFAAGTVVAAAASVVGRESGWDRLNLAGPTLAMVAVYALLAAWARSTLLLALAGALTTVALVAVSVARGDTAIGLQLAGLATLELAAAAVHDRIRPLE